MRDEATEESWRAWTAVAPGWRRHRTFLFESFQVISDRLVDSMPVREGGTILELTAGPGETGLMLAERAPSTRVIISDFSAAMVQAAADETRRRRLENVDCREIDAQAIDLPDSSVDGVMSRFGMMIVPDLPRAFAEIRRVLGPDGPLTYAVWGPMETNPWMMVFGAAMIQTGHFTPPEGFDAGLPLSTPEDNRAKLAAAGFVDIDIETVDVPMSGESFDRYWEVASAISGPLAATLQSLPEDEQAAVRETLAGITRSFRREDGRMEFPSRSLVVRATRGS